MPAVALVATHLLLSPASAQASADGSFVGPKTWAVGVTIGAVLPHEDFFRTDRWGGEYSIKAGPIAGVFADFLVTNYFTIGPFFQYARTDFEANDEPINIMVPGVLAKVPIPIGPWFQLRPCLGIGANVVKTEAFAEIGAGFDIVAKLQFAFAATENIILWVEYGFISNPYGEEGDQRFGFPPISHISFGAEFGS